MAPIRNGNESHVDTPPFTGGSSGPGPEGGIPGSQFATPPSTCTDPSDGGPRKRESFWKSKLAAVARPVHPSLFVKLSPDMILQASRPLYQIIECVAGLNTNPFLVNSEGGHYVAPDGSDIQLSILAVKKHWPTVRAQKGSLGDQCSIIRSTTQGEKEFLTELSSAARQMGATGAGLCLLLATLTSAGGDLHGRFREIILHEFIDAWSDFTCWENWCGKKEEEVESNIESMSSDFKRWTEAWSRVASRMLGVYDSLPGKVEEQFELMEEYGALRRCNFKGVEGLKRNLREEAELPLRMASVASIRVDWTERCKLRLKMVQTVLGNSVAPFVSNFYLTTDVLSFNELLESVLLAMGESVIPKSNSKGSRPSPPIKEEGDHGEGKRNPKEFNGTCDQCRERGHFFRSCPQPPKDQKARSKRITELLEVRRKRSEQDSKPEALTLGGKMGSTGKDTRGMRHIKIIIGGTTFSFGVDSGLDLSLISKNTLYYQNKDTLPTNVSLQSLALGHRVKVGEVLTMDILAVVPGYHANKNPSWEILVATAGC
jgi:hypothetical protein